MNETTMYDILESCLEELENGAQVDSLLAKYPAYAGELRPILIAAREAQKMSAPEPSREAVTRGRARLMQRVSELREAQTPAPRKRVIPFFQRLAISLAVTVTLVLSGTGLVSASSSALPGQNLYPVKRRWEDVRLFFAFDPGHRKSLEGEIKREREHEVNELLAENEEHEVEFSGVLKTVNGTTYISNLPVIFSADLQLPADGTTVEAKGRTTDKGYVEVTSFEMESGDSDANEDGRKINATPSLESAPVLTATPVGDSQPATSDDSQVVKPTPKPEKNEDSNKDDSTDEEHDGGDSD
jgi:hypothetical protein